MEASFLHAEYDKVDRKTLKRIRVHTVRKDGAPAEFSALCGRMARAYVNQKKNFLILGVDEVEPGTPPVLLPPQDGVLIIETLSVERKAGKVHLEVRATLDRKSGVAVWWARARDTEIASNEDLQRMTDLWVRKVGEPIRPYVAPLFIIFKDLFESLPSPILTEEDEWERIDLLAESD